jgi:hypothetical protein
MAYHLQANGMVERSHHQIKDALCPRLAGPDWPLHLPSVLCGRRAAPKEDSAVSSVELVLGAPLTLPGEILDTLEKSSSELAYILQRPQPLPTRPISYAQAAKTVPLQLRTANFVYSAGVAWCHPFLLYTMGNTGSSRMATRPFIYRLEAKRRL